MKFLGIRPTEIARMRLLLAAMALLGFSQIIYYSSASAIFLSEYSTDLMPHVYIANAICIIALSVIYGMAERRISFIQLLYGVIALFFGTTLLFWLALSLTQAPWLKFAIMVWYRMFYMFSLIGVWEIAARLLNIQEAKRLFTLCVTAMLLAVVLGGYSSTPLVQSIGTTNLLFVSCIGMALYLLLLIRTLPPYQARLEGPKAETVFDVRPQEILQNRYVVLIFSFRIIRVIASYILEFIFLQQASLRFTTESELAGFMGSFISTMTLFTMMVSGLFVGRYIHRFGLKLTLPLAPALVFIGSAALMGVGVIAGVGSAIFFSGLSLVRMIESVVTSAVITPVNAMLYQPLKASERAWVRVQSEGNLGSVAMAISGVLLLIFQLFPQANALIYVGLLVMLTGALWLSAYLTYQAYAHTLQQTVSNVFLRPTILGDQQVSTYGVDLAETTLLIGADRQNQTVLHQLLDHPDPDIKRSALERIGQFQIHDLGGRVRQLALDTTQPSVVRAAALRAWTLLNPNDALPILEEALKNPALQETSLTLMLQYTDSPSAREYLRMFVLAGNSEERQLAARVLTQYPMDGDLTLALLTDGNPEVEREAIRAAAYYTRSDFVEILLLRLEQPEFRPLAAAALISMGPLILPHLEQALKAPLSLDVRRQLYEICGAIGGERVIAILEGALNTFDVHTRLWALRALNRVYEDIPRPLNLHKLIAHEVQIATEILQVIVDGRLTTDDLLGRALEDELNGVRERLFRLFALIYPNEVVLGAYDHWQRGVRHQNSDLLGYVIEGLFVVLERDQAAPLFALIEPISAEERLKRLTYSAQVPAQPQEIHFQRILQASSWANDWTRACVVNMMDSAPRHTVAQLYPLVQEILTQKVNHMFSTIDKVIALRTVSIFSQTPDAVLSEVARILKEKNYAEGEAIIHKNEPGNRMYLIVEGRVRVHDGEQTLDYLNAPNLFGELSVLDAEPRSASVTAMTTVKVFTLERDALYQLMSTRSEIMEGVIRVLCQRARHMRTLEEGSRVG
ncbi:MAG: cyclic nucleotide-binding domain-containing protein [Anaerolineae bacterium]|jgi:HEAT repeat protein/ATP/ADP translocase|nr:cyclic nucleotide-binding domain-containing protein [Anaerolineae bacterium]